MAKQCKEENVVIHISLCRGQGVNIMTQRTANENAACLRRICKRTDQPKKRKNNMQAILKHGGRTRRENDARLISLASLLAISCSMPGVWVLGGEGGYCHIWAK